MSRLRPHRTAGFSLLETMFVLAIVLVLSIFSVQAFRSALENTRIQGDATAISRLLQMTRLRAGSEFTRTRLRLGTNEYVIEVFDDGSSTWVADGGAMPLQAGVSFGTGGITTPPPGVASVTPTHPVMFNSRGMPIDNSGVPTGAYALYLTDGDRVVVVRVSLGGRSSTLEFREGTWAEL